MIFASAFLMLLALALRTTGETVIQPPGPLLIKESAPLFINCTYQSTGYPTLFWYIQRSSRGALELFLKEGSEEQRGDGFLAKNNRTAKSFHLQKRASDVNDSATYFCAMSETGNTDRQTFGQGTLLKVIPNLEDSGPSLYKLKPQKGENENINACLITDYSPGNISAGLGDTLEQVNSSLVITDDGPSYGTVLWGSTNGKFNCVADYKGQKFNDTKDDDGTCRAEFETDERLNFLSLTVLGLRIIFLKTVAINLLLTFRLWSC